MLDEDFFMSHRKLYYDTLFEGYDVEVFQYIRQQRTFITLKRILKMMQYIHRS